MIKWLNNNDPLINLLTIHTEAITFWQSKYPLDDKFHPLKLYKFSVQSNLHSHSHKYNFAGFSQVINLMINFTCLSQNLIIAFTFGGVLKLSCLDPYCVISKTKEIA